MQKMLVFLVPKAHKSENTRSWQSVRYRVKNYLCREQCKYRWGNWTIARDGAPVWQKAHMQMLFRWAIHPSVGARLIRSLGCDKYQGRQSALFHNARLGLSSAGTWQNDVRAKNLRADKSKGNNFPQVSFHWCESLVYILYNCVAHVQKAAAINMHSPYKVLHDNTIKCVKWNKAFLCFYKKSMRCTYL